MKGISNYHEYLLAKTDISLPTSVNCKFNPIMHYIYSNWRRVTWRVRANVASRMSALTNASSERVPHQSCENVIGMQEDEDPLGN